MSASDVFDYAVAPQRTAGPGQPDGYVHAHVADVDNEISSNGTENAAYPLRSADAFESYCGRVQQRLAEHAAARIQFLQVAYDRLTDLVQTARDVEDADLYQELQQHCTAARELLEALHRSTRIAEPVSASHFASVPIPTPPGPSKPVPINTVASRPPVTAAPHDPQFSITRLPTVPLQGNGPAPVPSSAADQTAPLLPGGLDPVPRMPRRPLRPLADIEADAIRIRGDLKNWNTAQPLMSKHGGLYIPNCLLLRAVGCRQRRLEEEGGDTEVAEVTELRDDIIDLLDGANDQDYTVALDDDLDPRPTAYQWGEMAERYEEMARGQEAFEWWQKHRNTLSVTDIQPMAEAIAAIQQRFNRILFRVGARDPFQQALFDELRIWAREAQCFLQSLRPKVPTGELVERASMLEAAWEQAREVVLEEERRWQTVDRVVALVTDPEFGSAGEQDEERLREAVWECKQHRIPASDRRLRDALLPWAAFLESDERFREVLREINLEWERRQDQGRPEEATEEADHSLDSVWAEIEAVRQITKGKRCLMLGGTCREENRRKIEDALELRELVWPSTKPSDPLSKYDTEIRHSEIVALLTRFSRKEWKNAQDICARDGKRFVHLTSGYGVAQVVRHFFTQLCPEASGRS
jgi:hypothetical protein